jgi:FKBP-type peptidyl-prolyl cis-trans isomerase FkpA
MSRKTLTAVLLSAAWMAGCQQKPAEAVAPALTEDQKAVYAYGAAIGQQVGEQVKQLRLTPEEIDAFKSGFGDTLAGKKPQVEIAEYETKFKTLADARLAADMAERQQRDADFVANAAREPAAVKTESGLVFRTLTPGQGPSPKATDVVKVHYHGTLPDGKVFDSSVDRGEPAEFPLNQVIRCWTEGLQLMKVSEKAKLVCPAEIAYGDRGAGGKIPPGSTLVFEVELLEIKGK